MLFDTHVHLNAKQFKRDREEVIQRAFRNGVQYMVVVGFNQETIPLALEIAEQYETICAADCWHPVDVTEMPDEDFTCIDELSAHPNVVAIGEMALYYHWDHSPRDVQKEVCRKQIHLSNKVAMPINVHN